jgi:hypothetical protein
VDLAGRGRTNLAYPVLLFIGNYAHANIYMEEEAEAEIHNGRRKRGGKECNRDTIIPYHAILNHYQYQ